MQRRVTLSTSPYTLSQSSQTLLAKSLKIKQIDLLSPSLSTKIKYLDLSHNLIMKLQNMRQFIFLHQFDISHNLIKRGKELVCLQQLPRLYRLCVQGNPFLGDPLDQEVLEILIQKETDIQILSGEALNRIRDLQEGELKVVFLQNYLKKINCHDQILSRTNPTRQPLPTEQSTNHNIITKIMPQFYSIIDDDRLKSKIKKQTMGIKRQEQVTFEDAMRRKKEKQQNQVDNLIKDILLLVEEQDEEKFGSSRVGEERSGVDMGDMGDSRRNLGLRPVAGTGQKVVEEPKQVPEERGSPEGFRRRLTQIRNNAANLSYQKQLNNISQKKTKTQKSVPISDQVSPKNKTSSFSPWDNLNLNQFQQSGRLLQQQGSNFYSFNRTTPMPFRNSHKQLPQVREAGKFDTKKQQIPFSISQSHDQEDFLLLSTRRNQKEGKVEGQPSQEQDFSMNQKSAAQLYEQYYAHLTKYNPAFALLYSDISSLSTQQKQVLIQALAKDHKNKTIELFMQRSKLSTLKKLQTQTAFTHEHQKSSLQSQLSQQKQNYQLCKQYADQLHRQNIRLSQLIKVVSQDITDVKEDNRKLKLLNQERGNMISGINGELRAKDERIRFLEACEDLAEVVKANRAKRIKREYYAMLVKRADQNTKVMKWRAKRQERHREKLLNVAWSLLKKHLLLQVLAKMKQSDKGTSILKNSFQIWKQSTEQSKILNTKVKKAQNKLKLSALKYLRNKFHKAKQSKKQQKLHIFWADHYFIKNWFYKIVNKTQKSKSLAQAKIKKANEHYIGSRKGRIFMKIKQLTAQTKNRIAGSIKKLNESKLTTFYKKLQKKYLNHLLSKQQKNTLAQMSRILKLQRSDRQKIEALKNLKKENEEIKLKLKKIQSHKKFVSFKKFVTSALRLRNSNRVREMAGRFREELAWKRFQTQVRKYRGFLKSIRDFFLRAKRKDTIRQVKLQIKSTKLQTTLKTSHIKSFLSTLQKHSQSNKILQLQITQRLHQQQTRVLLQKMRTLESMQLQAIKTEHHKQLQLIEEEDIQKEISYRNTLMKLENGRNQLEDLVRGLRKEIEGLKERENVFFREKELIQQQVRIAESGKLELAELNQNLRVQIININNKYQRMLELYTQAMIQLQKKQKHLDHIQIQQKQRNEKTVQKQRRQIGLAKNGQFTSLRQRAI